MVISRSVLENGRSALSGSARAAIKKGQPFVKRLAMLGWRSTLLPHSRHYVERIAIADTCSSYRRRGRGTRVYADCGP
jgi:hypothetical protein